MACISISSSDSLCTYRSLFFLGKVHTVPPCSPSLSPSFQCSLLSLPSTSPCTRVPPRCLSCPCLVLHPSRALDLVWCCERSSGYSGNGSPPPVIDDSDQWEQWQTVTSAKNVALDKEESDR